MCCAVFSYSDKGRTHLNEGRYLVRKNHKELVESGLFIKPLTSTNGGHKHINDGGLGGDGVLAAVCAFLSHTQQEN